MLEKCVNSLRVRYTYILSVSPLLVCGRHEAWSSAHIHGETFQSRSRQHRGIQLCESEQMQWHLTSRATGKMSIWCAPLRHIHLLLHHCQARTQSREAPNRQSGRSGDEAEEHSAAAGIQTSHHLRQPLHLYYACGFISPGGRSQIGGKFEPTLILNLNSPFGQPEEDIRG